VPSITRPTARQRVTSDRVQLTGVAQPGSLVTIVVDEVDRLQVQASEDGSWGTEMVVPDGTHSVTAEAVNSLGSVSGISEAIVFDVQALAAIAPKITSPTPGAMVANSTIYITGVGQPEMDITVTVNDASHKITVNEQGEWQLPLVDPTGNYVVQAMHDGRSSEKVRFTVVHAKKSFPSTSSRVHTRPRN